MEPITVTDPLSHSADLTAENIERLRELFPEAVTEDGTGKRIDFDVLRELLGGELATNEEQYGLTWHGKRAARRLALTPSTGTLRPAPEESMDWDITQNLMIEGDNLEVLKLLQKSYAGKVNMIYIDPPYNTGKDFVYKDDFRDSIGTYLTMTGQRDAGGAKLTTNAETSGRFHTDWLNMMYPRLMLAKTSLKEDGVLAVSIDDHELENLLALGDEIFGEENHIATMIWEKGRKNDAKLISIGHEYIVLYARSISYLRERGTIWREEKPGAREIWQEYLRLREKHGDNDLLIQEEIESWFSQLPKTHPSKKWSRYRRIDRNGPWRDRDISWPGSGGPRYDVVHPKTGKPCKVPDAGWRFATPEEMQRQIRLGVVEFRDDESEPPFRKAHIKPLSYEALETEDAELDEESDDELATQVRGSYFYKQSQVSVRHLRELLNAKVFPNPKDYVELARLFQYLTANDRNALFMDFFAGSGSSGEAVLSLNAADGGFRRYILCQLPQEISAEKKEEKSLALYCDRIGRPHNLAELTKERLRRAAAKIKSENPLFHGDVGFRVLKLDTTSVRPWDPTLPVTEQRLLGEVDNILDGRSEGDLLYELLLKRGLELTVPIVERTIAHKQVYAVSTGDLIACLTSSIATADVEPLAEGVVVWHKELAPPPAVASNAPHGEAAKFEPPLIVFRDTAFADDVAKSNLTEILKQHGLTDVRSL